MPVQGVGGMPAPIQVSPPNSPQQNGQPQANPQTNNAAWDLITGAFNQVTEPLQRVVGSSIGLLFTNMTIQAAQNVQAAKAALVGGITTIMNLWQRTIGDASANTSQTAVKSNENGYKINTAAAHAQDAMVA